MRQELDHDEVSLVLPVTPAALYDLVTDITRTPEFSPTVVKARWVGGATGPAVGAAQFKAYPAPRRGRAPSNKPVVTVADPRSWLVYTDHDLSATRVSGPTELITAITTADGLDAVLCA